MAVVLITIAKLDLDTGCYFSDRFGNFGVSLGKYIIFGGQHSIISVYHEEGHQKQSLYLGWLYLIVVGLPSFAGNIYDRIAHRNWNPKARIKWYYNRFPENWADKLGGVQR